MSTMTYAARDSVTMLRRNLGTWALPVADDHADRAAG